jgi:hypothetical protein
MPKRTRYEPKSLSNVGADLTVGGDAYISENLTVLGDINFSDGTHGAPSVRAISNSAVGLYYSASEASLGIPNCALSTVKADGNGFPNTAATANEMRQIRMAGLTDGGTPYANFVVFESNSNGQSGTTYSSFGGNNYYIQNANNFLTISYSNAVNLRTDSENPATVSATTPLARFDGTVSPAITSFWDTVIFNDGIYLQDYSPGATLRRLYTTDGVDLYWQNLKLNTNEVASGGTATLTTEDIYRVTVTTSTITLPLAASNPGREITVVNVGAWTDTTIAASGSDYIDVVGTTSITLNGDHVHVTIKSDGTNDWMII